MLKGHRENEFKPTISCEIQQQHALRQCRFPGLVSSQFNHVRIGVNPSEVLWARYSLPPNYAQVLHKCAFVN